MHETRFDNFDVAARATISFLHRRLGMRLWMVTRVEGDDWIVLQSEDHGYDVDDGTVFRWADSFCSRMVRGEGPKIAPRSADVPAYVAAPIGRQVRIGAYIGVPIVGADGGLFGTLCAIDPEAQSPEIQQEQELVELVAGLLSAQLRSELKVAEEQRSAERLRALALTDALTGLFNRRGWSELLAREEDRCRRYGHPAGIIVIDLDDLKTVNDTLGHHAGDDLITRTGVALKRVLRSEDVLARVGGDEFTILAVECGVEASNALVARLRTALEHEGINASIGVAMRRPADGLERAWEAADAAMYEQKGRKGQDRPRGVLAAGASRSAAS